METFLSLQIAALCPSLHYVQIQNNFQILLVTRPRNFKKMFRYVHEKSKIFQGLVPILQSPINYLNKFTPIFFVKTKKT